MDNEFIKIPDTGIEDLSDGYHTFKQLYYQRMMLFATIVRQNRRRAWKSFRHEDGELCFGGGWFIVGIDTPEGSYTYHYEDSYYYLFDCEELERAKHWDGHTEKDVTRLLSLSTEPSFVPVDDTISRQAAIDAFEKRFISKNGTAIALTFEGCKNVIKNLPAAEPQWTPMVEQPPKDDDWKIVTIIDESGDTPYKYTDFGWYLEEANCWIVGSDQRKDVVAWMSLPIPWKGE